MKTKFVRGKHLYMTYCQSCHGADGNGIHSLGAPLDGSNWVTGDKQSLISIVLFGLTGPIKVNGEIYKPPKVAKYMPSFGQNSPLSDKDVAHILSYIRSAWTNHASPVNKEEVNRVFEAYKGRQQPFTMEELKGLQ